MNLHRYQKDYDAVMSSKGAQKFLYRKTYEYPGEVINKRHASFLTHKKKEGSPIIDHEIEGWLRQEDAAKLYELAYFCEGDIVELGTSRGLSAFIMSQALSDKRSQSTIYTVDMRQDCRDAATKRMRSRGVTNVVAECAEGAEWLRNWIYQGKRFGFGFIDHAHTYEPMLNACRLLDKVMMPGAFVAFHDYADRRNFDEPRDVFGVLPAIEDGLSKSFEFYGAFGCLAIYRFL